jgi:hypothetical protein
MGRLGKPAQLSQADSHLGEPHTSSSIPLRCKRRDLEASAYPAWVYLDVLFYREIPAEGEGTQLSIRTWPAEDPLTVKAPKIRDRLTSGIAGWNAQITGRPLGPPGYSSFGD